MWLTLGSPAVKNQMVGGNDLKTQANHVRFQLLLVLMVLLSSCAPRQAQPTTVRVGVLPVLESLPMLVADAQGYFAEEGILVEFVPVASAPERDQLMQSGQIDAMINEIVSVLLYNEADTRVVAVRFARIATDDFPLFRILAAQGSGITKVQDLAGVPIGISEGTVIEYTTDRLLERAGLTPDQIEKIAVPKIPDRLNLLGTGQLQAANLPDPAASLAILNGATLVLDDTSYPEISHSVISFSIDFVENQSEAVTGFLRALEKAVVEINSDKEVWQELLVERNLLPPPLVGRYTLPDFPTASIPSADQFADAVAWAQAKGLIEVDVPYERSVDGSYLP